MDPSIVTKPAGDIASTFEAYGPWGVLAIFVCLFIVYFVYREKKSDAMQRSLLDLALAQTRASSEMAHSLKVLAEYVQKGNETDERSSKLLATVEEIVRSSKTVLDAVNQRLTEFTSSRR